MRLSSVHPSEIINIQEIHQVFFAHLQSISNEPEKYFATPIVFYFYVFLLQFSWKEGSSFLMVYNEIRDWKKKSATMLAFAQNEKSLY